ncbi:hypothetical protein PIB30_032111 [Stylosanthes scabra]|uniref:AAA ATPase AAA+ lid domain-containing protein n=1 Tax=Stylosanthes scabra TaxID=79078 RepID=A0ABU6UAT2_9FABA|nr:hypothetical protein [Stylosanthes scabra]
MEALARGKPIDLTVKFRDIAKACEYFSGADLAELMNEAAKAADEKLTRVEASGDTITFKLRHFDIARSKVFPPLSLEEKHRYESSTESFKASRGSGKA